MNAAHAPSAPPEAKIKPHGLFSWVWLIPIVAAGLVAYLAYSQLATRGKLVKITFASADGIEVGQTEVRHKAVALGTVEDVRLAPDMSRVVVSVRMTKEANPFLTDKARFWVVRPRFSAGSLSGIETIVSGSFIEMDPGARDGKPRKDFEGLETPPGRRSDEPGRAYTLHSARLGALSAGAPVYFRDVSVGEVLSYDVAGEGAAPVTLRVFVKEPYDKFVKPSSRFWNASGLSMSMGPEGMHFEVESVQALLSGSIAFETSRRNEAEPPADDEATFPLYDDKATADAAMFHENIPYVTYFDGSVQGLARGSAVQLFGVQVGNVSDVRLVYDDDSRKMVARVAFDVQPERVLAKNEARAAAVPDYVRRAFVEKGLRAVLETSSMLTGAKVLVLEYSAGTKASDLPREGEALVIPSESGGLEGITASLARVAAKVDRIPFEHIGKNLDTTLGSFGSLATHVDESTAPALAQMPQIAAQMNEAVTKANVALGPGGYGASSDFQHGVQRFLGEMNDTARSLRVLTDYLDRHPEALLRGRGNGDQ